MDIFGIGIDIVELKRINRLYFLYGERFAKKILNDEELSRFFKSKNKVPFLAKRFAAKEAIGKALGIGIMNGFLLKNISIENDELGKPIAILKKRKEFESYANKIIYLSISDEKNFAVENALILTK